MRTLALFALVVSIGCTAEQASLEDEVKTLCARKYPDEVAECVSLLGDGWDAHPCRDAFVSWIGCANDAADDPVVDCDLEHSTYMECETGQ